MLSACGIWRKYEPVESVRDDLYGALPAQSADGESIAAVPWREIFADSCLQSLIDEALEHNSDIRAARLRVDEAQATLSSARLAYLPSFNFAPNGSVSSFDGAKASWTYSVPVTASWEIDLFGRMTNTKRQAQSLYEQSQDYVDAVQTQLIATIATQYYTLLTLDEQLRISRSTAESYAESVRVMRAMKQAGMTNEAGVLQIEAAYYATTASIEDIEQSVTKIENAISTLLGRTPGHIVRGTLAEQSFPEHLSAGIPLELLTRRPDVRAAEQSLAQSYYAVNIARASLYPSLTLSGTAGWTNAAGSAIVNPGKLILSAAGSLLQPIFNARANKARVKIARSQQQQAEVQFEQTLLNAGAEVNNALSQWQTALDKRPLRDNQVEALRSAVHKTELLMKHSPTTYLEVLTARQSLLQAELAQTNDRFDQIEAIISLYHALGGGVDLP